MCLSCRTTFGSKTGGWKLSWSTEEVFTKILEQYYQKGSAIYLRNDKKSSALCQRTAQSREGLPNFPKNVQRRHHHKLLYPEYHFLKNVEQRQRSGIKSCKFWFSVLTLVTLRMLLIFFTCLFAFTPLFVPSQSQKSWIPLRHYYQRRPNKSTICLMRIWTQRFKLARHYEQTDSIRLTRTIQISLLFWLLKQIRRSSKATSIS